MSNQESKKHEQNKISTAVKKSGFEEQLFYLITKGHVRGLEHLFRKWQHKKKMGMGYKIKKMFLCCGLCSHSPSPVNLKFFHREELFRYNDISGKGVFIREYVAKTAKRRSMQNNCAFLAIAFVFVLPALCIVLSLFDERAVNEISPNERFFLVTVASCMLVFAMYLAFATKKVNTPNVTCLHVAIMHGQVEIASILTHVWYANSNSKDADNLTPRQLLRKLGGHDMEDSYFHRQLSLQQMAELEKVLDANEEREKVARAVVNRVKGVFTDEMSEKNENHRYEEMMDKLKKEEAKNAKEDEAQKQESHDTSKEEEGALKSSMPVGKGGGIKKGAGRRDKGGVPGPKIANVMTSVMPANRKGGKFKFVPPPGKKEGDIGVEAKKTTVIRDATVVPESLTAAGSTASPASSARSKDVKKIRRGDGSK